jgi:nucleoside-diphosphate-sugar epimerase
MDGDTQAECVIVTGSSGFLGSAIVERLSPRYSVIGLDRTVPDDQTALTAAVEVDLTSDRSVAGALAELRRRCGGRIASVIHLAAYFDLTGEPNPLYDKITVHGTERLIGALQDFEVEQFVFASTMLVHRAGKPGDVIDEDTPLDPKLPYRASKVETERQLHEKRGRIPVVDLRIAGVYDDLCHNPFLARQIARISERSPKSHFYAADLRTGQSFIHLDDLAEAMLRLVDRRKDLPSEMPLLIGEPIVMSYEELQQEIARLIHGKTWRMVEIPPAIAKAGAWTEEEILDEDPFIKPWMVDIAGDHYALNISRAQALLGWEPRHGLISALPRMIDALKRDPVAWYEANKLDAAKVAGAKPPPAEEEPENHEHKMREHMAMMDAMRQRMLWVHFVVIALGAWLLTSPFQFALFSTADLVRDISGERDLWDPGLRNALTGWSDIVSGLLLMIFGSLSVSARFKWAQWGTTCVGLWLLFAPLFLWTPSAAAYANDTAIGALVIMLSILVPMMPGMSHEGMMAPNTVPPGWSYSPSTWLQRLPMIGLGFFGFLIARYMAAYQLGHIDNVWEPFFSGPGAENGTEHIITSDVSQAWPVADSGLGATSYLIEALMGAMGAATRWRTMPWMVTFFFILVVPLGGVSIFFIIIQPIVIGTYCTLCLIAAFAMLLMIPLTLDEVVAMGQYMMRGHRAGRPMLATFLHGGPDNGGPEPEDPGFKAPISDQVKGAIRGVTFPWTLVVSCLLGAWLMFSRGIFGTEAPLADSDHLTGAMIITVAIIAMAEVARPLRFLNVLFGVWIVLSPWLLPGGVNWAAMANTIVVGLLVIGLNLPRGPRSEEHYGSWDRYMV